MYIQCTLALKMHSTLPRYDMHCEFKSKSESLLVAIGMRS